jgi:hypothetical protein
MADTSGVHTKVDPVTKQPVPGYAQAGDMVATTRADGTVGYGILPGGNNGMVSTARNVVNGGGAQQLSGGGGGGLIDTAAGQQPGATETVDYSVTGDKAEWTDPGGWNADDVNASFVTADIKQGPRDITDPERVAWQMGQLADENGKFMQSATNRAIGKAAGRGLVNSSIAIGAGQRAAIDASLPIAQQDAKTYSESGMSAQEAMQKAKLDTASAMNAFSSQKALNQQNIAGNIALGEQEAANAMAQLTTKLRIDRQMEAEALANGDKRLADELANRIKTTQMEIDATKALNYTTLPKRDANGEVVKDANGNIVMEDQHIDSYFKQQGINFDTTKLTAQTRAELGTTVSNLTNTYQEQLNNIQRDTSLKGEGVRQAIANNLTSNFKASLNTVAAIYQLDVAWVNDQFAAGTQQNNSANAFPGSQADLDAKAAEEAAAAAARTVGGGEG